MSKFSGITITNDNKTVKIGEGATLYGNNIIGENVVGQTINNSFSLSSEDSFLPKKNNNQGRQTFSGGIFCLNGSDNYVNGKKIEDVVNGKKINLTP
jgi:hypothetical protein